MKKWLPWIFVAVFAAWFLSGMRAPAPKNGFDFAGFGRLPVLLNGRIQPFDSVARNALLSMSGKSIVRVKGAPSLSPTEWLLEAMTKPELANTRKIFRAQHPDLEGLLGAQKAGLETYSFNDLTNQLDQIQIQVRNLAKSEAGREDAAKARTAFQKDLMHLYNSVVLYDQIKNSLTPEGAGDFTKELNAYQSSLHASRIALQNNTSAKDFDKGDLQPVSRFFRRYEEQSNTAYPLAVPPLPGQTWVNVGGSLMNSLHSSEIHPAVLHLAAIATAYHKNEPAEFNQALASYRVWMQSNNLLPALSKGGREYFFNQIEPFYKCMVIYVTALLLGCVFWIKMSDLVRRSGTALLLLAFIIHTVGLGFRMYLEGRPPVTNLYSSSVFIGWGAVLLGLILERIFKGGIGLVSAGFIGFVTLNIAHHLSLSGDTMEMLRAVLDTNLWLSTHVVTVTVGYSSMFVAGLLAIIYIVRGFFTRSLAPEMAKSLTRMVYGIVCFSTLFSFVGTVLGGIWADQSWGRFWGWDPKENGALLIVLWNAIILHARWGGLIRDRGLMAAAVFGNIITSFSWFGVNMLGVGLHSYGFMDEAFLWLMLFIASQVVFIVLAALPPRFWASFRSASVVSEKTSDPVTV